MVNVGNIMENVESIMLNMGNIMVNVENIMVFTMVKHYDECGKHYGELENIMVNWRTLW